MQKLLIVLCLGFGYIAQAQPRIVTAGSSSSEIVCALGYGEHIVATDRTSLYPAYLQALPSIGYRTGIGAEGIIAQQPDLVIFERGYVKEELIQQLRSTGITTVVVAETRSWEGTQARIRSIGDALGQRTQAEALIQKLAGELAELKQDVEATNQRPKVLCVYARGQGNLQVGGVNSAFQILTLAGAENAVPKIEGFKPLNAESLIQANPDYILLFDSGLQGLGGVEGVLAIPGVAQTTAGKQRQIISMEGTLMTNWGPRLVEAARELFLLTHPEVQP